MKVFDKQGNVALTDASRSMKLSGSGSVSYFDKTNTDIYKYRVNITVPDASKPFLFCVKSDYDYLTLGTSDYDPSLTGPQNINFEFLSSISGPKDYRLYTTFDFEQYTASSDYGMKLFDSSGTISYDSRVPEAVLEDVLNVGASDGIITHSSVSTPFYAINLFPVSQGNVPVAGSTSSVFIRRGLVQRSSTETETVFNAVLGISQFRSREPKNFASSVPIVTSLGL